MNSKNIGSLLEFLEPSEEYSSRMNFFSNISGLNTMSSRNNPQTPHDFSWTNASPIRYFQNRYAIASTACSKKKRSCSPAILQINPSKLHLSDFKAYEGSRPKSCSPELSIGKIKVIYKQVNSVREKPEQRPKKLSVNLQDKVRNEIMYIKCRLKRNQVILRTMNTALRSEEKKTSEFKQESDAAFHRLSEKMRDPKLMKNGIMNKPGKVDEIQNLVRKSKDAANKCLLAAQQRWLESHGGNKTIKASKGERSNCPLKIFKREGFNESEQFSDNNSNIENPLPEELNNIMLATFYPCSNRTHIDVEDKHGYLDNLASLSTSQNPNSTIVKHPAAAFPLGILPLKFSASNSQTSKSKIPINLHEQRIIKQTALLQDFQKVIGKIL